MDKKISFDVETLIPVLLGVFSLMGMAVVFGFANAKSAEPLPAPSETPFRFIYLGTEPGISTQTPEDTPTLLPTDTPVLLIKTSAPSINPSFTNSPIAPSTIVTITPTINAVLLKIDDTDTSLLYNGLWENQSNVNGGAYQNTLHISFTVGNSISYTFTGQQVIVSYQSGPSLGRISITLDGLVFEVDQSNSETKLQTWQSQVLVKATHTLRIEHLSGGSINLDSITIPDLSTPTPTLTATPITLP